MTARSRKYSIRQTDNGTYLVRKNGRSKTMQFPNIEEALHFIRRERRGTSDVKLFFYAADGELLFTEQ